MLATAGTVFCGVFVQARHFLGSGVVVRGLIAVFVPPERLVRWLPRRGETAVLAAGLAGASAGRYRWRDVCSEMGDSRRGGVDVYARGSRHQSGGGGRDGRRIPRSAEDRHCHDTSGSLTNRLVTITGFVLNQRDGVDLARIVISCCAADAQLARIHLRGPASGGALRFADNTWLRVESRVESGVPIPTLDAVTVTHVDAPANPYV